MEAMRIPIWICGIVTLAIVAVVWVGTSAHADDQIMVESPTISMIGKPVKNSEGKTLGKIKDLVINWRSDGYAQYAVLSVGGFMGLGEEHVAVPWATLVQSKDKEHFVLNMKEEHLKAISASTVYRFYDRSSAVGLRSSRSTTVSSAHALKGNSNSQANISIAMSFGMQNPIEPNIP